NLRCRAGLILVSCLRMYFHSIPMTSRPPCSTPFPYTTLFRSVLEITGDFKQAAATSTTEVLSALDQSVAKAKEVLNGLDDATITDRKSTRLNSSHQIISYAVFCLKKKKKNLTTTEH